MLELSEGVIEQIKTQAEAEALDVNAYLRKILVSDESKTRIESKKNQTSQLLDAITLDSDIYGYNAYSDEGQTVLRIIAEILNDMDTVYDMDELNTLSSFLDNDSHAAMYFVTMLNEKIKLNQVSL